jgi:hypothetical protein
VCGVLNQAAVCSGLRHTSHRHGQWRAQGRLCPWCVDTNCHLPTCSDTDRADCGCGDTKPLRRRAAQWAGAAWLAGYGGCMEQGGLSDGRILHPQAAHPCVRGRRQGGAAFSSTRSVAADWRLRRCRFERRSQHKKQQRRQRLSYGAGMMVARAHSHSARKPAWMLGFGQFDFASYPQSYPRFAFRRGRRRESLS